MKKKLTKKIFVCGSVGLLMVAMSLGLVACGTKVPEKSETVASSEETDVTETGSASESSETITITDMAGREVTFPANPQKVFSSSPASEAWLCALVPDRMIGWANKMTEEQLAYYPKQVAELPLVGGWYGYTEGNVEGIITMAPDVVISAYNLTDEAACESAKKDAEELSTKLGTPVICVSYVLEEAPEVMRALGEWLGVPERGENLAKFMQEELDKVSESIAKVPDDEVVSYYYAEDAGGLMTESADSFHAAVFTFCGLKSVSDVTMSSFMGKETVSMEQVINWNPQYIFAFSKEALNTIRTAPEWAGIDAVENEHVYFCANYPQNWFDRSPNPLRVLGCLYVASTCYPDHVTYNLDEELTAFFKTMYDLDLTEEQIQALYRH